MKLFKPKKSKIPLLFLIAIPGMIVSWIGMGVFWVLRRKKKEKKAEE